MYVSFNLAEVIFREFELKSSLIKQLSDRLTYIYSKIYDTSFQYVIYIDVCYLNFSMLFIL